MSEPSAKVPLDEAMEDKIPIGASPDGNSNLNDDANEMNPINLDDSSEAGMEEMPAEAEGRIYRTCSVNANEGLPLGVVKNSSDPKEVKKEAENVPVVAEPAWSFTRSIRNGLLKFNCCGNNVAEDDVNSERGIELEGLCEAGRDETDDLDGEGDAQEPLDDVAPAAENAADEAVPCPLGPVLVVDCSNNSVDTELKRVKAYMGDVVRKLIIRNPPIKSVLKILAEPLLTENVTLLHIENCDVSVNDLCLFLDNLKLVELLNIEIRRLKVGEANTIPLEDDFISAKYNEGYFNTLRGKYTSSGESLPPRLRVLSITSPMIWQCSMICQTIEAILGNQNKLEQIHIKSSLKEMISQLIAREDIKVEDVTSWKDLVTLDARNLIQKSSSTLKYLTISCADNFPLEYMKISRIHDVPIEELFKWCFYCTCGLLNSITNVNGDVDKNLQMELPLLTNLNLDLPLVPIPMIRDDEFRKPLNVVAEFLAHNNAIQGVSLYGLRPVTGLENWIKNSLVTIPKNRMTIGCTYTSTTLSSNLPTFDDELASLGLEIVPDETRQRVGDIIEPNGMEVIPHTWRYNGMKSFHLINRLPTLVSYDLNRIASKFVKLTKLTIEDYTMGPDSAALQAGWLGVRSLNDLDMQTIFKQLSCLEYLHLDCNMKDMTDRGLTGVTDTLWTRLTQRNKMLSFWYLYNLKYLFLRGFGEQVTDKSAIFAFSEEYSMKKLQELHVFSPGFTNYGLEKIRKAYEKRDDFILEL